MATTTNRTAENGTKRRNVESSIPGTDPSVAQLEELMRELIVCYEQLTTLADLRHDAIRGADTDRLSACIAQENEIVQQVAEIEKRRISIVKDFAARLGSPDKTGTTLTWIAERVEGAARDRLHALAERLRTLLEDVSRKNEVIEAAAERISSHIDGLMRTVTQRLNHAQTYGRRGDVPSASRVVSALDTRS